MQAAYDYAANDTAGSIPLPGPESTGEELLKMGLLYSTGQGGAPLDYISAHTIIANLERLHDEGAVRVIDGLGYSSDDRVIEKQTPALFTKVTNRVQTRTR